MKNILLLSFAMFFLVSCKDTIEPQTPAELISLNEWSLERFTDDDGSTIANSSLNTEAAFLYALNFEFKADGEVRGLEKSSNTLYRGLWVFIDDNKSINVKLQSLDYDFEIISLEKGKMVLQAPTGNFLSGVGELINLEFIDVAV